MTTVRILFISSNLASSLHGGWQCASLYLLPVNEKAGLVCFLPGGGRRSGKAGCRGSALAGTPGESSGAQGQAQRDTKKFEAEFHS